MGIVYGAEEIECVLRAAAFAADRHKWQRRKGAAHVEVDSKGNRHERFRPYVNHPLEVAARLWAEGGVRDLDIAVAAILHDTVEDTETTLEEIEEHFGRRVREIVAEVTDDKRLSKAERKQHQIDHAPHLSTAAKQVKLSDKISNIRDVTHDPPSWWDVERRVQYLDWADSVVAGLRGANPKLEAIYDDAMRDARERLTAPAG
jgi:guanosine-3',5'-bis(diphosphate) 3'-pyrophosphohydrolase